MPAYNPTPTTSRLPIPVANLFQFSIGDAEWCHELEEEIVKTYYEFQFSIGDAPTPAAPPSQAAMRRRFNSLLEMLTLTLKEALRLAKELLGFNSLLEMPLCLCALRQLLLGLRRFNSLLEMPCTSPILRPSLSYMTVSILYWRCVCR